MADVESPSNWDVKMHAGKSSALGRLQQSRPFTGFVANVDAMKFLSAGQLETFLNSVPLKELEKRQARIAKLTLDTPADFAAALYYGFQNGKALELPCYSEDMIAGFERQFGKPDQFRIGGQAGIIANLLTGLGTRPLVYCPLLSPLQAGLFDPRTQFPIVEKGKLRMAAPRHAARKKDATKTNWIFEFGKHDRISIHGKELTCPRSNRLIVLSKLISIEPLFSKEMEPHLAQLAQYTDRAMIAGFHHLHGMNGKSVEYYLHRLSRQLEQLKTANPDLKIHIEYVMIHDEKLARQVYRTLGKPADSLGINEVESRHVLKLFGFKREHALLQKKESAHHLYLAAQALANHFDFARVHAHTLGYYVLYLKKRGNETPAELKAQADSLLFAGLASEARILQDRPPTASELNGKKFNAIRVSELGLSQMRQFASDLNLRGREKEAFLKDGFLKRRDHFVFVVPAPVNGKPKSTVGLGDTISATAFLSAP